MQLKVKLVGFGTNELKFKKEAIINKIATKGVTVFRDEITKRKLINTKNLIDSVGATIKKNGVTFDIDADYAEILNRGVKKHKMRYLIDVGPIPIVTKTGQKIFRMATTQNVEGGKWTHPGFKRGKGFFDVSVNKIDSACKEIIMSEGII
jgi:hypothetical protein